MNLAVYHAAHEGAVWRDMTHFGRFRVEGRDAATLLHHLTTSDIKRLCPGQSCDAPLISNKARVLDWLTIARDESGFTVITSPNRREMLVPHARRFILFRQDVTLREVSGVGNLYALFGATLPDTTAQFQAEAIQSVPTQRLPGNGLWLWSEDGAALSRGIASLGIPACDPTTFNVLRVEAGVPVAGAELTEEVNPWEANLGAHISLAKGCYNGQEIVARLNTYQKVKQKLCGLRLDAPLAFAPGDRLALQAAGKDAGFLTSAVESPQWGPIALGYVRTNLQTAGQRLTLLSADPPREATEATVVELPFTSPADQSPQPAAQTAAAPTVATMSN